jgi:hypothetical protein
MNLSLTAFHTLLGYFTNTLARKSYVILQHDKGRTLDWWPWFHMLSLFHSTHAFNDLWPFAKLSVINRRPWMKNKNHTCLQWGLPLACRLLVFNWTSSFLTMVCEHGNRECNLGWSGWLYRWRLGKCASLECTVTSACLGALFARTKPCLFVNRVPLLCFPPWLPLPHPAACECGLMRHKESILAAPFTLFHSCCPPQLPTPFFYLILTFPWLFFCPSIC